MNDITIFSTDNSAAITYKDKKEREFTMAAEAALFKGGLALKALKDHALLSAANKALNGRYRAAADILSVAFPKEYKAFTGFLNCDPWANSSKMCLFIEKCEQATPGKNGWTAKQHSARALMQAMRANVPALKNDTHQVIEA